jgi:hypothetical protein
MKKIAFYLASDTLVYLCKPILEKLFDNSEVYIIFPRFTEEKASETYKKIFPNRLDNISTEYSVFKSRIDTLVCANDWGAEIQLLIWWARKKKILTIAIQESVVDFSLQSNRYLYADVIFAQGEVSQKLLRRSNVIVTGNPRYENISFIEPATSVGALINCNFTYGVYEEVRDIWIKDVTQALKGAEINFKISKHPRDFSNLIDVAEYVIPSGAGVVHEQVKECKFLITRFSSLIHESIMMGRPVIYYNPHREDMGYDFGADNKVLFIANNPSELIQFINIVSSKNYNIWHFQDYISHHMANHGNIVSPSQEISCLLKGDGLSKGEVKRIKLFRYALWLLKQLAKPFYRFNSHK